MVIAADTWALVFTIVGGVGTAVGIITGMVAFVWHWQDRQAATAALARETGPRIQTFTPAQMREEIARRAPRPLGTPGGVGARLNLWPLFWAAVFVMSVGVLVLGVLLLILG